MSNNIKKELLGLMQKAVKLEVEKNGNEASRYCPVILHQPKRPKKLKQVMKILLCKWKENREVEMMQSISSYINPNTRGLTSNYKNTAIKDKEAYNGVMSQHLLNPVEDLVQALGQMQLYLHLLQQKMKIEHQIKRNRKNLENIILVLADMAIIISHKIHIEVCQWLLNGMIVAALLNLCGKIQTKCRAYKN